METTIEKRQESIPERTHTRPVFRPRCDIVEDAEGLRLVAEMPGVSEENVNLQLEKNVLTISGSWSAGEFEGFDVSHAEFRWGDYERAFTLSNEIDQEKIEASMKDGLLEVFLPKREAAKPKKILVKAG